MIVFLVFRLFFLIILVPDFSKPLVYNHKLTNNTVVDNVRDGKIVAFHYVFLTRWEDLR